jgi:acyl-CoA thioester hydrolase
MFRHKYKPEIRFSDIDAFDHVNNARYLTYFEQARIAYFREIVGWNYDWSNKGIILAKAVVDYIVPVLFKDDVSIYTRCSRLGNKSFDLQYRMVKTEGDREILLSDASTVMVAFDYDEQQSIEIPAGWKDLIRFYEMEKP